MGAYGLSQDEQRREGWLPARVMASLPVLRRAGWNWQKKAFWTLSDQALFSGSNFLTSVLLARWLTPDQYGAYSLGFSIFLMFSTLHSALLVEPMLVFGSGKYADAFKAYLRSLVSGHLLFMIPATLLFAGVALCVGRIYDARAESAVWGLVIGCGGILLFWLVRRAFYPLLLPSRGAFASFAYFSTLLPVFFAFKYMNVLTAKSAFVATGIAGAAASILVLTFMGGAWRARSGRLKRPEVLRTHWTYGRWALGIALVQWLPANIYSVLLPKWVDLEATGALRALMNIAMPVLQAISALSMLLIPSLVRQRSQGRSQVTRVMRTYLLLFLSATALYAIVVCSLRTELLEAVYTGRYSRYGGLPFVLAAFLPFGSAFTCVLASGLRALERPDQLFWSYVASALSCVCIGLPLTAHFGVTGALFGLHTSAIVSISMMVWLYRRTRDLPARGHFELGPERSCDQ